jgi:hypothetical protein
MNFLVWTWVALAVLVVGLAICRNLAGIHGNWTFHVLGPGIRPETKALGKIETIEHWGELLTLLVVVYGLALAGIYLYTVTLSGRPLPH